MLACFSLLCYSSISFKVVPAALLFFFPALTPGAGIWVSLFSTIIGGGAKESFLYPIYAGIILLAGLVVLCTCVILDAIHNTAYYNAREDEEPL